MPSNWFLDFKNAKSQQVYASAQAKVKHMASELIDRTPRRYKPGPVTKVLVGGLSRLEEQFGSQYFGKSLTTDSSCNLCGLCSRSCPAGNITQKDGRMVFSDRCLFCMRCIYQCPQRAIASKGYQFCVLKNGYNLEKILDDPNPEGEPITAETRGYFKHFKRYLDDISL
jgi:ferredoxin